MELTSHEKSLLYAARNNDYVDAAEEPTWVFAVIQSSGLTPKVARGALASLVKKGLITVCQHEPGPDGMVLSLTKNGIQLSEKGNGNG